VPEISGVKTEPEDKSSNFVYLQTKSEELHCKPKPTPFLLLFSLPDNTSTTPELYWLHQDTLEQPTRLLGFKLLALSSVQPDIRPASGWWWPEPGEMQNSGPGTGLTVDYQNGLLTLITENFNADGQPEWLLGTAPLKRGVTNTELIKFSQGQTLTGEYQQPLIENSRNAIHIRFLSASRAEVWLESRQGNELDQSISLRKLTMVRYFMDPPILDRLLKGRWLVAPEDSPDYARQAQQFRILSLEVNGHEASLGLVGDSSTGKCQMRFGKNDSPPQQCEIQIQGEQEDKKWTFTSFSMDRMRGHDQYGARVTAFRINPD
jgi:hypothetical protein